jgi:hypothetical protein
VVVVELLLVEEAVELAVIENLMLYVLLVVTQLVL